MKANTNTPAVEAPITTLTSCCVAIDKKVEPVTRQLKVNACLPGTVDVLTRAIPHSPRA